MDCRRSMCFETKTDPKKWENLWILSLRNGVEPILFIPFWLKSQSVNSRKFEAELFRENTLNGTQPLRCMYRERERVIDFCWMVIWLSNLWIRSISESLRISKLASVTWDFQNISDFPRNLSELKLVNKNDRNICFPFWLQSDKKCVERLQITTIWIDVILCTDKYLST